MIDGKRKKDTGRRRTRRADNPPREAPGELLFVYGTLRRGEPSAQLLGSCLWCGETETRGTLFHLGKYPALTLHGEDRIYGEVWRCSPETLALLDSYEGVEEGLFERVRIHLEKGDAWIYVAGPALGAQLETAPRIPSGKWSGTSREP